MYRKKGDQPCANDSTYSYPYITYKVKGVYVMKDGKPVMENGIPLQQDFVAELPMQTWKTLRILL